MSIRRPVSATAAVAVVALLAAGCGGSSYSSSGGSSTSSAGLYGGGGTARPAAPAAAAASQAVTVRTKAHLGRYLTDARGRALYLFEKDRGRTSTCTGACAQVWPPVTTSGTPMVKGGAVARELSTVRRADGTRQLLYAGHPLYRYAPDGVGTTAGEGLKQFGAEWYVLAPSGTKVEGGGS